MVNICNNFIRKITKIFVTSFNFRMKVSFPVLNTSNKGSFTGKPIVPLTEALEKELLVLTTSVNEAKINSTKERIYNLLKPKIDKLKRIYVKGFDTEEIVSNVILNLYETIDKIQKGDHTDAVKKVLSVFEKQDFHNAFNKAKISVGSLSLDAPLKGDSSFTFKNFIDVSQSPVPLSNASPDERKDYLEILKRLIQKTALKKEDIDFLNDFYGFENEPLSKKELAKKYNIKNIKTKLMSLQWKLQLENKVYSKKIKKYVYGADGTAVKIKNSINEEEKLRRMLDEKLKGKEFLIPLSEVKNNIVKITGKYASEGLTVEKFLEAAEKNHKLYEIPFDDIKLNISFMTSIYYEYGITTKKFIKAALEEPKILTTYYDDLFVNNEIYKRGKSWQNVNMKHLIKFLCEKPAFFLMPAEEKIALFKGYADRFEKTGIRTDKFLNSFIQNPKTLDRTPQEFEKNIKDVVKYYANDGLKLKNYLNAMLKAPENLSMSSQEIINKVNAVSQTLKTESLTPKKLWRAVLKHPSSLSMSVEELVESIKLNKYVVKCGAYADRKIVQERVMMNIGLTKNITGSKDKILTSFLASNVLKADKIKSFAGGNTEKEFVKYLQNNKKTYKIELAEDELADEVIKFAQDFSNKHLGRNIFVFSKIRLEAYKYRQL